MVRESVDEFLKRGGLVKVCPPTRPSRPAVLPVDLTCPVHKVKVREIPRFSTDEKTGKRKFHGSGVRCPVYQGCRYHLFRDGKGSWRCPDI